LTRAARAACALLAALALPAVAQDGGAPPEGRITVIGRARAELVPDFASVEIGVETRAKTPSAALDGTSKAAAGIIALAGSFGVADADVGTSAVTLQALTRPLRQPDGTIAEQADGYRAANVVRIRLADMGRLGELMRRALDAGANRIEGVGFGLKDPDGAEADLRVSAMKDAVAQAGRLAEAAGLRLGAVIAIQSPPQGAAPPAFASAAPLRAKRGLAVPLAAGAIEAGADVAATFAIRP
jgi:hypothetical protein